MNDIEVIFISVALLALGMGFMMFLAAWADTRDANRRKKAHQAKVAILAERYSDWTPLSIGELTGMVRSLDDGLELAVEMPKGTSALNFNTVGDVGLTVSFSDVGGRFMPFPTSMEVEGIGTVWIKAYHWYRKGQEGEFKYHTIRDDPPGGG